MLSIDEYLKYSTTTQVQKQTCKIQNITDFNRKMSFLSLKLVRNNAIKSWKYSGKRSEYLSVSIALSTFFVHSFFLLPSKPFPLSPCQIYKGVPRINRDIKDIYFFSIADSSTIVEPIFPSQKCRGRVIRNSENERKISRTYSLVAKMCN